MSKQTHLIEEYNVKDDTILCVCGWKDNTTFFPLHQELTPPTSKLPSPDRFAGEVFNGPIDTVEKGITREITYEHPDLFDYVNPKQREKTTEIFDRALVESDEI